MRSIRMQNALSFCMLVIVSAIVVYTSDAKNACDIPCTNGGICKRRQLPEEIPNNHRFNQVDTTMQSQRHYCQCLTGYVGSLCEIKLLLCPAGVNGTCTNGSACKRGVDDANQEYYHCECDLTQSDLSLPYATKFCEHESTIFCISDIDAKQIKHNRQSLGGASRSSFCTNGGTCKDVVTDNGKHVSSCDCPSDFSGSHCEKSHTKAATTGSRTSSSANTSRHRSIFFTVFVFFVCFFTITAISLTLLIWYGNRNRVPKRPKSAQERAKIPKRSEHTAETSEVV